MSAAVAPLADFVPPVRKLPHSIEAESACLGGALLSGKALDRVAEFLKPEHFALAEHRTIFAAMTAQRSAGRPVSEITLAAALEGSDGFAAVGGVRSYLGRLIDCAATPINAGECGRLIREMADRRAIIEAAEAVAAAAYEGAASPADLLARLQGAADAIDAGSGAALAWECLADHAGEPIPDREWIAPGWVPAYRVTLLYGDGGTGKSRLGLQLLIAVATGTPWLGLPIECGAAMGVFCEDEPDELLRRSRAICRAHGIYEGALCNLHWVSLVGRDATLVAFDRDGNPRQTALWWELRRSVLAKRPRVLMIDPAASVFAGNAIDPHQVRFFVGAMLEGLAMEAGCAVGLLAHPSQSGMASGAGTSGSVQWSAACRSRLYLTKGEDGSRKLSRPKANYAPDGSEIALEWRDGVFAPIGEGGGGFVAHLDRQARERQHDEIFLACLREVTASGRHVSDAAAAQGRYAPKLFRTLEAGKAISMKDHEAAMARLFAAGRIVVGAVQKPNRHKANAIVEVAP